MKLQAYEGCGIQTITPGPSQAILNYERRREQEVMNAAAAAHIDAIAKADLTVSLSG